MNFKYCFFLIISLIFFGCSEDLIDGNAKGTLTGSVRMETSNEPMKNVKITTTPASLTVFTDEEGNFEIRDNLPLGDFSVRAELKGYVSEYQSISITEFEQKVHVVFEMITDNSLNDPPTVPTLVSPKNLADNLSNNVELEWECTDPDGDELVYKLIFTNNKTNNRVTIPNIKTLKTVMTGLDFGTAYTWQVVASDSINKEVYSEAFQFTVRKNPEYRYHFVRKNLGKLNVMATNLNEVINVSALGNEAWRPKKNNTAGKLAYLQTINGQTHLFTSDLDGYNEVKISQISLNGFRNDQLSFAWNTDGSQLIFPSFDKLYKINSNGTGQTVIYKTPNGHFITKCAWSNDGSKIAIITNDINGYQAKIIILDSTGNVLQTILENVQGAVGGLDFSITGNKLLYTHDVSGNEVWQYRQLDTRIFIYDFTANTHTDFSTVSLKQIGSVDLDPIFSPDNSEIIFTNTSNDMLSVKKVCSVNLNDTDKRTVILDDAEMVDFK